MLRTISRAAIGGSLGIARMPLDAALRMAPDTTGPWVALALDRADATIRHVAAMVLSDEELAEDARRRSQATDERARALRLREEARDVSERADERVAKHQSDAEHRRRGASESAERKRNEARERRDARKDEVARATGRRKQAVRRSAASAEEEIDDEARRARLEPLETKVDALDQREKAQVAADEARRLRNAASQTKARRKRTG